MDSESCKFDITEHIAAKIYFQKSRIGINYGCDSVVENIPLTCETRSFIPSTTKLKSSVFAGIIVVISMATDGVINNSEYFEYFNMISMY